MTIGIPRALFYWKNPIFWETFFEGLGEEVILSPKTNKEIVGYGIENSDSENCFSMKVFFGHILWLDGKCDCIFVPRLKTKRIGSKNQKGEFKGIFEYCPKFFGIPDLANILTKTTILSETFDEKERKKKKSLERIGKKFKKRKPIIEAAINEAYFQKKRFKEILEEEFRNKIKSLKKKIIVVSHPYNLYDDYVNLGIKKSLENLGAEVLYIDQVPIKEGIKIKGEESIDFHWEFGREIMERLETILLDYDIDGVIEISSFQCGCDAVLKEFVEKDVKKNKTPFLYLIIDEQSGEAGIQTRLEAFMDNIK